MKIKIKNIGSIVTWSKSKNSLSIEKDLEILIEDEIISEISKCVDKADLEIDANYNLITPGFIDSHTHPIYSGSREQEFGMRISGKSYKEIADIGGGINSTVKNVRATSIEELYNESLNRINYFIKKGTTTIEAKSGYGLTLDDEIKSLQVIKNLQKSCKIDIVPSFMGAHAIPKEYENNRSKYIEIICNEMIPKVAKEKLATFCDVFCEQGYFSIEESRKILKTAQLYGLNAKLHADEFEHSNAAELAGEINAVSADHLMKISDSGIKSLAENGVIATLLPGTTLFLGEKHYAPGRKIIDGGCEVALATDYNPGSCTIQSIPLIMSLAVLYCGLTIEEAFKGVTWNASKAIAKDNKLGLIKEGYQADLLFWNIKNINEIPYWMNSDRIVRIIKSGEVL